MTTVVEAKSIHDTPNYDWTWEQYLLYQNEMAKRKVDAEVALAKARCIKECKELEDQCVLELEEEEAAAAADAVLLLSDDNKKSVLLQVQVLDSSLSSIKKSYRFELSNRRTAPIGRSRSKLYCKYGISRPSDDEMSQEHGKFHLLSDDAGDQVPHFTDTGSSNGSYLGFEQDDFALLPRLASHQAYPLQDGHILQCGQTIMKLILTPASTE